MAVSATALILLSPLMLAIAVLIKLDSQGPVVFRHVRRGIRPRDTGRDDGGGEEGQDRFLGRPFTLYKFRTMFADARERFPELYTYQHTEEELRTLPIKVLVSRKSALERITRLAQAGNGGVDDPRVTRVGRWLRRTSLDELPNLFNVLRGDMALVGPRPDIAEHIRYYSRTHLTKLDVKPGITGLAQIKGRGTLPFAQINDYDVEYVQNRSLLLDLKILLMTLPVLLRREGAF